MTVWGFYRLVFKRAWERSFDRARKFWFLAAIGLGVLVLIARHYLSVLPSKWLNLVAEFAWTLPLAFLLLSFLWLVICAPYELYREKVAALDAALPVRMAAEKRAAIRDVLATFLERGQDLIEQLERARNLGRDNTGPNDLQIGHQAIEWLTEVENYMSRELDSMHRSRFRDNAYFPSSETIGMERPRIPSGLQARCDNLLAILREFS